jgi:glycosyltransferase domain-containing protein
LNRLLDYYLSQNVKIIVVDSSKVEFCYLNDYKDKILYKHYPEKPLAEKIYSILPYIDTPYVVMCANDDFIIPETIQHIINFLDKHDDYNSGQGLYGLFDPLEKSIPLRLIYPHILNEKIDENNAADRVMHLMSNYFQYYYAVYRTSVFKETYSSVIQNQKTKIHNLCLLESYISSYPAIMGKHFIINELYACREYNSLSVGNYTDNILVVKSEPKYKDEYCNYINLLSNKLLTVDNLSYQVAEKIIIDSIDTYIKLHFKLKKPIRRLVKKFLSRTKILLTPSKIIYNLLVKTLVRHKNKPFPKSFPEYEKWEIIRNFILKYYTQCY